MIHDSMNFWAWAFLKNAEALSAIWEPPKDLDNKTLTPWMHNRRLLRYNVLTSLGCLIRVTHKAIELFQELSEAGSLAPHILAEGLGIRGLNEHAEEYFIGPGRLEDKWIRETQEFSADASSDVDWLIGGRLDLRKSIEEVQALSAAFAKVPPIAYLDGQT